jgi:hypothetical protein
MPSEKILVVDDSREMRELMVNYILRPHGYTTPSSPKTGWPASTSPANPPPT